MIDIRTLTIFAFVKLNEITNVRKISVMDVLVLDQTLIQEAHRLGIKYNSEIVNNYYTKLNYNPCNILDCYEDEEGYIIRLANEVDINLLKEEIKDIYNYLDMIAAEVDFGFIFLPDNVKTMNKNQK